MVRFHAMIGLVCGLMVVSALAEDPDQDTQPTPAALQSHFQEAVQPVLEKHCYRCHGPEKMKSAVRVDILNGSLEDKQLFLLKRVVEQLEEKVMPPEDEAQPTAEQREMVVEWMQQALLAGQRQERPRNGSVRRLTVAQYHQTLRDLLGVEDRLADALPADAISEEGFKNNEGTLLLTPQMMESYFEIAEKALDLCLVDEAAKPRIQSFRVELGQGINKEPYPGKLELNGPNLLPKADFLVHEVLPEKSFAFEPRVMQKKFRFIEGYAGNATVRGWRDFEGLYHSVYAALIGKFTGGRNYGRSSLMVPEGLLLRPRSPETENGSPPAHGPSPTFSMPLRELPRSGMFQITVEAARYDDGLQPDAPAPARPKPIKLDITGGKDVQLELAAPGIYQVDVVLEGRPKDDVMTIDIGKRSFGKRLKGSFDADENGEVVIPLVVVRSPKGSFPVKVKNADNKNLLRAVVTRLEEVDAAWWEFAAFERRQPHVSVHMGVRTDVGPRLTRVGEPRPVTSGSLQRYTFRAPMSSFPSLEMEEDNVNYLAGLREIAVRSEPTDDRQIPRLLLRAVEFEGPFYDSWPPRGHRSIFIPSENKDDPPAYAREVIERFGARAFRRPLRDEELTALLDVWKESHGQGSDMQKSVRDVLLVVLTSPQFLFLIEESASPQPEPLTSFELAAKLSYFLWNTTPDEKLVLLAEKGTLRENLEAQVDRLVADERFTQFAEEFVHQWLSLDKFDVVNINRGAFPRLIREVRRELRKEPVQFLQHLIRGNLSLRHLIASDFIVANDVVAGYYGIGKRSEKGYAFTPIRHESGSLGGVLTQVAILSGLSDGHESNPVKRGAWLARRIIAEPPEPPPPNVPDLPEGAQGKSLRERLEQHRNQEGCQQCHEKIDPWGLPFEEYDAGGLFKTKKVDSASTLPDGTEVDSVRALKEYLAEDRIDQVAFSFLKHLASYAIGRSLAYNELEYLKREGRKALAAEGYRMKDCVQFIIESPMFMEK